MKKFLAVSAAFLTFVVALFITLGCVKPKIDLNYDNPTKVLVYAQSSVALQNGVGDREFSSTSITYRKILEKTEEVFKVSMFDHAMHGNSVFPIVEQDVASKYAKYSSNLLSSKYAVMLSFDETQKQVVSYEGDKKTISYKKLIMLFDPEKDYQEVPIYFSTTSETGTDYDKSPMVVNIKASALIDYINEIK